MNHTNQLIHETSPYLLQHAHNPVNWLPFGAEAFEEASRKNKPLLISIGYSSCHWCHVMEHESFENEDIATLMNTNFVCVKVDREERPDVDHVYMDAVQQIHNSGGWPLNCFALPDGKPFWGGTYFRPEQWIQLLTNIGQLYQNRFSDLEQQANELAEGIARQNYLLNTESATTNKTIDFSSVFDLLFNAFDSEKGGFSGSPKFPMPVVLNFMMQYSILQKDESALIMVDLTLKKMACGGINDQAGGGFARYSTDSDWKVPHFEKMLYDNAQLVSLYSSAFQLTKNRLYKEVIEQTIEFVNRELTAAEGVFYSALDADSEGEEGLFYTWSAEEFNEVLGHYSALAGEYYEIDAKGLWENGRNILLRPDSDDLFAQQHFLSADELSSLTGFCRARLLKARSERIRPGLDDKMLVAWNSLMISALLDAYCALDRIEYLESAIHAANFILINLKRPDIGLYHTWKNEKSQINAFLDDYAFTCEAFLKLYSVTTDEHWLNEAGSLASYVVQHLYDSDSGFFWYSENNDKQVFTRKIEIYDGVIPSGNSVMASVLNTLGIFLHNSGYSEKVQQMLLSMESRFTRYPSAYANWASLAFSVVDKQNVIAVVGNDAVSIIKKLKERNLFSTMIFGSKTESNLPYFENRFVEGKTLIYICSGTYCMAPVESVEDAVRLLSGKD
ncbi:MAG: thioredoxin domain-containing protein [Bacteroidales bacterium]|nr:thioredoxin domain-containing protein [Bacteroidales bacterium]